MQTGKVLLCAIALSGATSDCVRLTEPVGLQQLIANNQAAVNGKTDTSHIQTMEYDIHIKEVKKEYDGVYRVSRHGQMRIDIFVGGTRVYTEAYDGQRGWEMDKSGAVDEGSAAGAAALWHGTQYPSQIFSLQDLATNGHKVEYTGRETVDGVDYYVLKLTLSDGFETYRYINPDTWMIERGRDFRALHVDVNAKKQYLETVWSDFRPVDGVMRPFGETVTDLGTRELQQTITTTAVQVNPAFDTAIFYKPSAPIK